MRYFALILVAWFVAAFFIVGPVAMLLAHVAAVITTSSVTP